MSPAHYMAEYVHIWYILCAPVRDFACAFVCTLATAKQHTKERRTITAEKQNFLCVLCRGESHARALQLPLLLSSASSSSLPLCAAAVAAAYSWWWFRSWFSCSSFHFAIHFRHLVLPRQQQGEYPFAKIRLCQM